MDRAIPRGPWQSRPVQLLKADVLWTGTGSLQTLLWRRIPGGACRRPRRVPPSRVVDRTVTAVMARTLVGRESHACPGRAVGLRPDASRMFGTRLEMWSRWALGTHGSPAGIGDGGRCHWTS